MHALAGQTVEVCGQGSDKSLTFTGLHLGDTSLMQNDAAYDLYGEVLHAEHPPRCLAAYRESVGQDIVGGLAVLQAVLQYISLGFQLLFAHGGVLALQSEHLIAYRADALELARRIIAEQRFE